MIMLRADPVRKLICVQLSGFLLLEDVAEFARIHEAFVERHGWSSGEHFLLVDSAHSVSHSQEGVAALQDIVARAKFKAARVAVVRPNASTRMQARRIVGARATAKVFDTLEEAERRLF